MYIALKPLSKIVCDMDCKKGPSAVLELRDELRIIIIVKLA